MHNYLQIIYNKLLEFTSINIKWYNRIKNKIYYIDDFQLVIGVEVRHHIINIKSMLEPLESRLVAEIEQKSFNICMK